MAINFTTEELKKMKSLVRMELEEVVRTLDGLSATPANIKRIKSLETEKETLNAILAKMLEA